MSFPKRHAIIEPHEGRFSCKITSGGKFVSATLHETDEKARAHAKKKKAKLPDRHGNYEAEEGCDRCECGAKYWEHDRCVSCGAPFKK